MKSTYNVPTKSITLHFMETARQKIKNWSISSTIHGVPKIYLGQNQLIRTTWLLLTCLSLGLFLSMAVSHVSSYLKFDVITQTLGRYVENPVFPTVTICNLNPFNSNQSNELIASFLKSRPELENDTQLLKSLIKVNARILPTDKKKLLGYTIEEMIISCRFFYLTCNVSDFAWYYSMNFGNCFQFNAGTDLSG